LTYSRRWLAAAAVCIGSLVVAAPASAGGNDRDHHGKNLEIEKTAHAKRDNDRDRDRAKCEVDKYAKQSYFKSRDDYVWAGYKVRVKCDRHDRHNSDFKVYGDITVRNPNKDTAKDVKVEEKTFDDCRIYGGSDEIDGYDEVTFHYSCKVKEEDLRREKKNEACVSWDRDSVYSPDDYACDEVYIEFDRDYSKDRSRDCTSVYDKLEGYDTKKLGDVCDDYEEFEYYRKLYVPRYGCKDYVNWAFETSSWSKDYAKVTVCRKDRHDH